MTTRRKPQIRTLPSAGMPDPAVLLPILLDHLRKNLAEAQNSSQTQKAQQHLSVDPPARSGTQEPRSLRILRLQEVEKRVGLHKTQIYALMKVRKFPIAVKLTGRVSGWFEHEIDDWLLSRAALRADE